MELNSNILLVLIILVFIINTGISIIAYFSLRDKKGYIGPRGIQGPRGIDK